jgi:hypothetical protein
MTTPKQTEATRRNAQKSMGPRTREGKAASRMNALSSGLCAVTPLLPGESPGEFADLAADLYAHFDPEPGMESTLVQHLVLLLWRLGRVYRVETGVFAWYMLQAYEGDRKTARLVSHMSADDQHNSKPIIEVETSVETAEDELMADLYEARGDAVMELGRAFVSDGEGANALIKVSRYETTLLRGIERTRRELEALQAARPIGHVGEVPATPIPALGKRAGRVMPDRPGHPPPRRDSA